MIAHIISPSISPNTERDDVHLAINTVCSPSSWKTGDAVGQVESWFRRYFNVDTVASTNSGRSALMMLLQAFRIGTGDEVIIQAFTCVAVPEVVMWMGATPVYGDIDRSTYNIAPHALTKAITKKTKAIIIQHTFGIPASVREIVSIAHKHDIVVIEDCAHSLGATVGKNKVGSFGDASFFSFGRDKVISSVFGGVALLHKTPLVNHRVISAFLRRKESLSVPSYGWIAQQLLHPILMNIGILPLYRVFGIGKLALVLFQKIHVLSFPVYPDEAKGIRPPVFPARLPNALAILARNQLKKLYRFNVKRQLIAKRYGTVVSGAIYLRYPVYVDDPDSVCRNAKKKGIHLGRWYSHVVDPSRVDLPAVGYTPGQCPVAEDVSRHVLNLPTYPAMREKDVRNVLIVIEHL